MVSFFKCSSSYCGCQKLTFHLSEMIMFINKSCLSNKDEVTNIIEIENLNSCVKDIIMSSILWQFLLIAISKNQESLVEIWNLEFVPA